MNESRNSPRSGPGRVSRRVRHDSGSKGFLLTLAVVAGLLVAGWFLWDPYISDLLPGGEGMRDGDRIVGEGGPADGPVASGDAAAPAPESPAPSAASAPPAAETAPPPQAPASEAPPAPKSEIDRLLEEIYPMPEILPLETIVDGWRNVPERAYPAEVVAAETVGFRLVVDGRELGSSSVAPGTPLKPVRLAGDRLTVANLANPAMTAELPVDSTDFKQRITQRYEEFVEAKSREILVQRERAKEAVGGDTEKLTALAVGAAPALAADGDEDPRIRPVRESLHRGEVSSVKLEEAVSFTWNGREQVGGRFAGEYDTVTVRFEVETIFGRFPVVYKALLRGGRVEAWIDPVTQDRV